MSMHHISEVQSFLVFELNSRPAVQVAGTSCELT